MPDIAGPLIQLVGALAGGGVLLKIVELVFSRRKNLAETESVTVNSMGQALDHLQRTVTHLDERVQNAEDAASEATIRAAGAEQRERELRALVGDLVRQNQRYQDRLHYVTSIIEQNGIRLEQWDPPKPITLQDIIKKE